MNVRLKREAIKTSLAVFALMSFLLFSNQSTAQSEVIDLETFDKIVVSPHIEVIFKKGEKESVSVESITVPMTKLNVIVKNNTLNIYLDGAKIAADTKKENINGYEQKTSIYKGTVVRAIITYKEVNSLDLRGEERFVFESFINSKKLRLSIYGESQVYFDEVDIKSLLVSIYGESYLEIKQGKIEKQKFTAYGESKVNTMNVESKETKLTAYGDGTFQINVSEKLKITSYGEATINYSGSPTLNKGIVIGETKITNVNF
tara:strand:+ start:182 stop:961 length:780 start_codon:yes stop_codon:yes gene_type:complete